MKFFNFLLIFLFTAFTVSSQNYKWAKSFGGKQIDSPRSIASDSQGNVYTIGEYINDTVDFDPGSGIFNLEAPVNSIGIPNSNIFIQKLDSNGNFIWAISFGDTLNDTPKDIKIDAQDNIYLIGGISGQADMDPSGSVYNIGTQGSGESTAFLLKLDANGNFIWCKAIETSNGSNINFERFVISPTNEFYILGFSNDTIDFDPGPSTFNLYSDYGNTFLLKLDSNGNFIWVKQFLGDIQIPHSIIQDGANNIYTSGVFTGTVDFNPGVGVNYKTSNGFSDFFIAKWDTNGNTIWINQFGGNNTEICYDMSLASNNNDIYFTGGFEGIVDFDPGPSIYNLTSNGSTDLFIGKLDSSSNLIWAKSIGNNGIEMSYSIFSDSNYDLYVTGYFEDTVDFDPSNNTFNVIANPSLYPWSYGLFLAKYNSFGDFKWIKDYSPAGGGRGLAITIDNNNNIYYTGEFIDTIDFNPPNNNNFFSNGLEDIFIIKNKLNLSTDITDYNITSPISIKTYPNPAETYLYISTNFKEIDKIEIFNIDGKLIKTIINNKRKHNISSYSEGTYLVRVQVGDNYYTEKFIKK